MQGRRIREIDVSESWRSAEFFYQSRACPLVEVRKRHTCALLDECAYERRSNAGGSSGDKNALFVKAWITCTVLHLAIPFGYDLTRASRGERQPDLQFRLTARERKKVW